METRLTAKKTDCKGNTGVGNSAETQETIYNDKIEEIGIKNKMIANRKILNKEASAFKNELELDSERKEYYENQQKTHRCPAQ